LNPSDEFDAAFVVAAAVIWGRIEGLRKTSSNAAATGPIAPWTAAPVCPEVLSPDQEVETLRELLK
jgi:hypothetical protein